MTTDILEKFTGFSSFFECVKWLYRDNLDKKEVIKCVTRESEKIVFGQRVPVPSETVELSIPEIKEKALIEVVKNLPSKEDLQKISQSIVQEMPSYKVAEIMEIINKIPTK